MPLADPPPTIGAVLAERAAVHPDRVFLAERDGEGWRTVTYAETHDAVRRLGRALADRGADPDHPVMLLSENAIDHALVQLAAMWIGAPAAPVSPAYSLLSADHSKLRYVHELLTPSVVYTADGDPYADALAAIAPERVVVSRRPRPGDELLADLLTADPVPEAAGVGPDTVAKVLFTSGSTGVPKGVLNTHRMLCANQQAIVQLWPFLRRTPPVVVDWLPWSHTFGGNHNFNLVLCNGGTLYIDAGKPIPGRFDPTLRNLAEISPTMYFNVPAGFAMLVPRLEADSALRARFFERLQVIFYAAAALPQDLWRRLEDLSIAERGARVRMLSAWGSTETAPMATAVHFPIERAGVIGLPAPGTEIALVPVGDRQELRVRGPNVTPGYWRRPDLTEAAFDDEGFFLTGDAGRLADPDDPAKGLVFDGRLAENFKLASGTWVHAGALRVALVETCRPVVRDLVLTGHDRHELGVLVFPDVDGCRAVAGAADDVGLDELVVHPAVHGALAAALERHNAEHPTSSRRIGRALLMVEPPDIDAGEITDKGYLNQRAVLDRRAALVERLYRGDGPDVLVVPPPQTTSTIPQGGT
ncbi:MAG TPA: feruloyl-CoA synthase [Actinobacteria bacterium]|nr:feruloyl-CoA synthase [Actinomycetota bacterium]